MKAFCTLAYIDKFLQTTDYVSVNKCFNALSFFGKSPTKYRYFAELKFKNIRLLKNTFYTFKGQYEIFLCIKRSRQSIITRIYKIGIGYVPKNLFFLFSTRITFGCMIMYNLLYDDYNILEN